MKKAIEHYGNTSEQVVVVVIDLNQLKTINDCFGHTAGDEAILDCANVIKQSFKGIGSPFRIGGDEFCVLCKDIPAAEVDRALNELDHAAKDINSNRVFPIVLAYGYSVFLLQGAGIIFIPFFYVCRQGNVRAQVQAQDFCIVTVQHIRCLNSLHIAGYSLLFSC
ncbi:GGDEF domain-containing protein [Paenibacillus rhizoplanae]